MMPDWTPPKGRKHMSDSIMYHDGNRRLQDQFDSRRISDRLEQKLTRTAFTDDDKTFIESALYFFLATADAQGRPDCSFKGGTPGFVRVTGPSELAFPDYDGNGMFKSLGNLLVNPQVGMLFIDMHQRPRRLRQRHRDGQPRRPAARPDSRRADDRADRGPRHLSQLPALYPEAPARRAIGLRAPPRVRAARAGLEGVRRLQRRDPPAPTDLERGDEGRVIRALSRGECDGRKPSTRNEATWTTAPSSFVFFLLGSP
jgi:predicted pyridoxine 5'-phosphate oxidase superfamily flavin-nucleotide-binding protein